MVTRVLCIDHEGGHGGSSFSLFHMLSNMDRRQIQAKVICRKQGEIQNNYAALGIKTNVEPELPLFSPTEVGWKRNLSLIKNAAPNLFRQLKKFDGMADEIENRFDVVHFNHVSLFALAARLRRLTKKPFSMHIRTRPGNSILSRLQSRSILKTCNRLIFITENEQRHFNTLAGEAPGDVIFNPAVSPSSDLTPHSGIPDDKRLKIASFKQFSPTSTHTRLVEIAQALREMGAEEKVLFLMAGNMRLWRSLPGKLGLIASQGGDFEDYVKMLGLTDMFQFLGWVPNPGCIYAACDLVAAPGLENNPWGRDIIESYSHGKPVIATGIWDGFVKHKQTGLLAESFDARTFAQDILLLAEDRDKIKSMGEAGRKNIALLCSPRDRARDLQELWQSLAHSIPSNAEMDSN